MIAELQPATDLDRFNAFYDAHHAHLQAYISGLIYNPQEAEHVCQDTWLKVFLGLPYAYNPSVVWLFQIAKYTAIDEMRKIGRRGLPPSSLEFEMEGGTILGETLEDRAGDFTERVAQREAIALVLAGMNPFYAEALRLEAAGYRYSQISLRIGRHAKSTVMRGRRAFRARWEREEKRYAE